MKNTNDKKCNLNGKKNTQDFLSGQVLAKIFRNQILKIKISHFVRDHHHSILNTFIFRIFFTNFASLDLKLNNRQCHNVRHCNRFAWKVVLSFYTWDRKVSKQESRKYFLGVAFRYFISCIRFQSYSCQALCGTFIMIIKIESHSCYPLMFA